MQPQRQNSHMAKLTDWLSKHNEKFTEWMHGITEEHIDRAHTRIEICEQCARYSNKKWCKECDCYMPLKVILYYAKCPLEKW